MSNMTPVQKTWDPRITEAQKQLAKEIRDKDPRFKQISKEDFERLDAVFWRYRKDMTWHAAASAGIRRILTRNPAIPTAAAGWIEGQIAMVINIEWFFSLNLTEQIFVLAHETEHIVRNHLKTIREWPHLQKRLNFVMDALINTSLDMNFPYLKGHIPTNMITYDVFKTVANQQPKDPKCHGKVFQNPDAGTFQHVYTAEELLKYLPKETNDPNDPSGATTLEELMDKLCGEMGEFFDDDSVPDEIKDALIEGVIDEATKAAGAAPGHLRNYVEKIKDKTNRDWRRALRGVGSSTRISMTHSWSHINKRLPFLRPGKLIFTRPSVLVIVDRSGSVGPEESADFIKEMNGLVQWVDMDIIYVDAHWDPKNPQTYVKGISKMEMWKHFLDMSGGTYFKDVYDWLMDGGGKGKYETVIMLTDGYLMDHPRVPGKLGRYNVAILTPNHDQQFVADAKAHGYQICVIDDSQKRRQRELRGSV